MKISDKKIQNFHCSQGEQNKRTTRTLEQKLNMNHVAGKKLNQAQLKKAFRIKLFELCKTRTKKSNPDLLNFYVISTGHDMVNDAGKLPRAGANSKPHDYKQKVHEMKDLQKKNFTENLFEYFRPKKNRSSCLGLENKTNEPRDPKSKNWFWTHASRRK